MRIALVHDYLSQDGGAERVLKYFHEIWPEAPIFVLFHDQKKISYFNSENIRQSFLAKMPFIKLLFQWYLPWMPAATEHHHLRDFDLVLSSTSAFAKGVITAPDALHISYCHTPPRYLWADAHDYLANLKRGYLINALLTNTIHKLRIWDKMSADRVEYFIANSKTVQQRIQKYYRRSSDVIYPPADMNKFYISPKIENYFSAGGRLVPYKRLDLVIKVFNRLKLPLKIFGTGPELPYLKKIAKPNIEFLSRISEAEKARLLSRSLAFIHPQLEDFGITPIEAMASGRPVIAYGVGGATETVIPNETGVFFNEQTWESLLDTIIHFEPLHWDSAKIREHALQFSTDNFKNNIKKYVLDRYEEFEKGMNQEPLIK